MSVYLPAESTFTGDQNRVGVADQTDVRQALVLIGTGDRQLAGWIVEGNRSRRRGLVGGHGVSLWVRAVRVTHLDNRRISSG